MNIFYITLLLLFSIGLGGCDSSRNATPESNNVKASTKAPEIKEVGNNTTDIKENTKNNDVQKISDKEYTQGKHYKLVDNYTPIDSSNSKIKVEEFFWYGCSHCYSLELPIKKWLNTTKAKNIDFIRIPAALGGAWDWHAHYYYTSKYLNILDKSHHQMFDAIHIHKGKGVRCSGLKKCGNTYAKFINSRHPEVSVEKFSKLFHSFGVLNQINKSKQLAKTYKITGVPSFVINGKYITDVKMAGSVSNLFAIIEMLVAQEINS